MSDVLIIRSRVHVLEAVRQELELAMSKAPATGQRHLVESFLAGLVDVLELGNVDRFNDEELQRAVEVLHSAGLLPIPAASITIHFASRWRKIVEALEFYGDPAQYARLDSSEGIPAGLWVGDARILIDRGEHARKVLSSGGGL